MRSEGGNRKHAEGTVHVSSFQACIVLIAAATHQPAQTPMLAPESQAQVHASN